MAKYPHWDGKVYKRVKFGDISIKGTAEAARYARLPWPVRAIGAVLNFILRRPLSETALNRCCASNMRGLHRGQICPTLGMKPKVLIVDDEKNICESLATIFMSHGFESKIALSAEQAFEMIAEWEPGSGDFGCRAAEDERH